MSSVRARRQHPASMTEPQPAGWGQPVERATATTRASPATRWWRTADARAVALLLAFCAAGMTVKAIADDWLGYFDTVNFFLPYFGYLGERLGDGEIPAWNPYFSGGAPMIGDPGSGWLYLPVMISFTLFSAVTALKVMILLMSIVSGLALYAFARTIGLWPVPALLASAAFAVLSVIGAATSDGIAVAMTFPPTAVGLLAAERAIRARRLPAFVAWSCLGGVAIVQNFASWPTHGLLFTGMYMVGWLAYRALVALVPAVGSRRTHLAKALGFGLIVIAVVLTFGLSVILPVFGFADQSTLSGADYSDLAGATLGTPSELDSVIHLLLGAGQSWSIRIIVPILALVAVAFGRNWYAVPFFAVAVFVFIDLSVQGSLLRPVFDVIPFFQRIHDHRPAAINNMISPALTILSGAGLQLLLEETRLRRALVAVAVAIAAVIGAVAAVEQLDLPLGMWPVWAVGATAFVLIAAMLMRRSRRGPSLPIAATLSALAIGAVLAFPFGVDLWNLVWGTAYTPGIADRNGPSDHTNTLIERNFADDDPGTAAEFLQRQAALRQPFRYAAYYGVDAGLSRGFDDQRVGSLSIGRSSVLGLEQISGYNPIHLRAYSEYMDVLNGSVQDYHFTDLHWPALGTTQLLSMLNVRYVVVTTEVPFETPIASYGTEVYRDDRVIVYENPYAFPRAWIVHEVRPATDDGDLQSFTGRGVDGRTTAFVQGPMPRVALPRGGGPGDEVVVTESAPERLELSARSSAPGLLVVSQAYAEGWNAYVDGERVDVPRTNHALQGVPLPAGEHEVVLKYEPRELRIGLWSTGLASVAMLGIWGWALWDWRKRGGTQRFQD